VLIVSCLETRSTEAHRLPTVARMATRTALRRHPERTADRTVANAVLDEALHCHVGLVRDGAPVVLPTIHARVGDVLYLHGSPASGLLRDGRKGIELCVTATVVDALVLAKSAYHHSLNYRSVVIFGTARRITDTSEKRSALEAITEHVAPGRWRESRRPSADELRATEVIALPIEEFSAKARSGPPIEEPFDLDLDVWSGVVPVQIVTGEPIPA
jgi:nitroimidazol reductase NimA-like FMN-containing flavoprotein (pyridoxamine 5'-phosphate oxidase superfamily)